MRIVRRINEAPVKSVSLGVVGKIKIGEKISTENGKSRPVSLDYFRADAPEQYTRFFRDVYGEKPAKITVVFLSNDMNEVCRNFYELRDDKGGRLSYGDGNTFHVSTKQGDGSIKDVLFQPGDAQKWMNEMENKAGGKWRERLVLRFAIPALPLLGVWEFSTHGAGSTIPNIVGTIDTMQEMAGRIAGIPFDLIIEKVKSDKAGSKSVYPVVKIIPNISPESAAIVRGLPMQLGAILTPQKIAELSGGETIHEETADFEIIEPDETEAQFFQSLTLETVADFTAAVKKIEALKNKTLQVSCAKMLGDKAQQRGYRFDKATKSYLN